jgi:hypothetical protein
MSARRLDGWNCGKLKGCRDKFGEEGTMFEEVIHDCGDAAVNGGEQRANRQVDGANTTR